jgi:hypothetical protein
VGTEVLSSATEVRAADSPTEGVKSCNYFLSRPRKIPDLTAADYTNTREFELTAALVFASIILVVWTLPNALLFYRVRSLFVEDAGPKK